MYSKLQLYSLGRKKTCGSWYSIFLCHAKLPLLSNFGVEYRHRKITQLHTGLYGADGSDPINESYHYYIKYSPSLSHLRKNMDASLLLPPASVRGMTELNVDAFEKKISVPHVIVQSDKVNNAVKYLKKYLLKMVNLKPVISDENFPDKKVLLLNPLLVNKFEDVKEGLTSACGDQDVTYISKDITLNYDNWKADEILSAVLPEDQKGAQSYSLIGHILHLNLKEHIIPYKSLIGQVYLDKLKNISLVVNKTNNIDSTYRNFEMEVLAGTGDTIVTVKENGCAYTMDFTKVYWNPRLSTEHERVLKKLKHGDVLYDVMAGIGPFAVPAGKKKCIVLANDLNPSSFDALVKNCSLNNVTDRVKCFNLDGQEFIKTTLKTDLWEKWQDNYFCGDIHITMNLPAMAVEFLPAFVGLYQHTEGLPKNPKLPLIHVYMFTSDETKDTAVRMVEENLGFVTRYQKTLNTESVSVEDSATSVMNAGSDSNLVKCSEENKSQSDFGNLNIQEVVFVRKVAPSKSMMRVSFFLPLNILLADSSVAEEPPLKKIKDMH